MKTFSNLLPSFALLGLLTPAVSGCNAYRMKTPNGFAEVQANEDGAHYKGRNNVGLRVATFHNVKGGTLEFWSEDLVRKLGARGYSLVSQSPAESKNGKPGTRFDFEYQPPGEDEALRKYSVILFVTDKHRIVMQLAGQADLFAASSTQLGDIASETKVRGCLAWTDICKSPQPPAMATPAPETATAKADVATQPAAEPNPTEIAEDDAR